MDWPRRGIGGPWLSHWRGLALVWEEDAGPQVENLSWDRGRRPARHKPEHRHRLQPEAASSSVSPGVLGLAVGCLLGPRSLVALPRVQCISDLVGLTPGLGLLCPVDGFERPAGHVSVTRKQL